MSAALQLLTWVGCVITLASCGQQGRRLPAPERLSYHWLDGFVVNVTWSWSKPQGLPEDCSLVYEIRQTALKHQKEDVAQVKDTNFHQYYLSEDLASGSLELRISSKPKACEGWYESEAETVKILPQKQHAELVKDFKCYYFLSNVFNCSWTPLPSSKDLTVSYRVRGKTTEDIKSLRVCNPDKIENRHGCTMECEEGRELFVVMENKTRMATFQPENVIYLPEMNIVESNDYLNLTWTNPTVGPHCTWKLCLWYKECGKDKPHRCQLLKEDMLATIPYHKCCGYEFKYNLTTIDHCSDVKSNTSKVISYGTTKTCQSTTDVVAIVVPIILFCCVALSIYLFHKNYKIFILNRSEKSIIKNFFIWKKEKLPDPEKPSEETVTAELISRDDKECPPASTPS